MMIHVAETGRSFELCGKDCQQEVTVEHLQDLVSVLTGVHRDNQLLLAGSTYIDPKNPKRPLGTYGLPSDDRPVYLFNKERFAANSRPPPPDELRIEPDMPTSLPPLRSSHALLNSSDPVVRALPTYEQQFKHHLQKGHALLTASQCKLDACKRLAREIQVQAMALEAVRQYVEQQHRVLGKTLEELYADFQRQSQQHAEILGSFGSSLSKLRDCTLHPALWTDNRGTLIDCVDEGYIKSAADECALSHKQFCAEVASLNTQYAEVKLQLAAFLSECPDGDYQTLEVAIEERRQLAIEQDVIMQSLSKSVTLVARLIGDCENHRRLPSQTRDMLACLGPIYDRQQKGQVPRMEECDTELRKLLNVCLLSKNAMNRCVQLRIKNVVVLQRGMQAILASRTYKEFVHKMVQQQENIEPIKQVRRIGNSYKACLAEVARRKGYIKLYMGQAGQLAERLARKREMEVARREEFMKEHGPNLPADLPTAMGLSEMPSQCLVEVAPFDTNLLDIDITQVEQYAPRYLLGSLVSVSDDWTATEAQEIGVDNVTGTSKLEVENARLKAQLASSIAIICSLDSDFQPECLGDPDDPDSGFPTCNATAEALRLKDAHANELKKLLNAKHAECKAYEERIRELEERLRVEDERKYVNLGISQGNSLVLAEDVSEASGVTGEAETKDAMDAVITSSASTKPDESGECDTAAMKCSDSVVMGKVLQNEKTALTEDQAKQLLRRVFRRLELLQQCQMNSADLERRLHDSERRLHEAIYAAERKDALYTEFRSASAKLCGVIKGLQLLVSSSIGGFPGLVKTLRDFSNKLSSEAGDHHVIIELINCFEDKVESLAREQAEVMALAHSQMKEEMEGKAEVVKSLFAKCKLEKQASREKVCLSRFEVHELALFLQNAAGHYEALNRSCPNYYLSDESIALFCEQQQQQQQQQPEQQQQQQQQRQRFILGQIVHIEHHIAQEDAGDNINTRNNIISSSGDEMQTSYYSDVASTFSIMPRPRHNPYRLPPGTPFSVVTLAMLPGL